MRTTHAVIALAALALAGPIACLGGGGGGNSAPRPIVPAAMTLTSVTVSGTTDTIAAVDGNGVADADGVQDLDWSVTVPMDGSALPTHAGSTYSGTLTITAVDSEQRTRAKRYDIEVNP